ncbi:uncharacterized protein LOC132304792 [Cornus florida]|uniref:uncharacterized protein LOC132304792 n=1 Tax=Cornus florida TaxID=4283 RepID=UPI00289D3347|nr:uncharacterized protein LOC132304792 [Cornus florida]
MQDKQAESSHKLTVWTNGIPDGASVQETFDEKRLLKIQTPAEIAREHKNSLVKTPFIGDIYLVDRPKKFTMPSFTQFDGTGDPSHHLDHYSQKIALDNHNDTFMCKVFSTSLTGAALEWFKNRPHKSIPNYETLYAMFLAQYCRNKKQKKTISSLFTIRQKRVEMRQDFLSKFNMEASKIADCHPETAIETFKIGIIRGTKGELVDYLTPKEYVKPWEVNPWKVEGNQVKVIHVIYGRSEDDQESEEVYRSRLRAAHKLRKLSSVNTITSGSISNGFGDGDLSRVQFPHEDPLVISLLVPIA